MWGPGISRTRETAASVASPSAAEPAIANTATADTTQGAVNTDPRASVQNPATAAYLGIIGIMGMLGIMLRIISPIMCRIPGSDMCSCMCRCT